MELSQLRVRKSSYFKDGNFTDGWLIEFKGAADHKWTALSFRDRLGEVLTWYDSEESAKAKFDEIKDAINAQYASHPTASHQTAGDIMRTLTDAGMQMGASEQSEYIANLELSVELMQKKIDRIIAMCDGLESRQYVADFARGISPNASHQTAGE